MTFAVIRIRGRNKVNRDVKETLRMLNLTRSNHCVIIPEEPTYRGMLQKAKDYITWGEVDEQTLVKALRSRGEVTGQKRLTDDYISNRTDYKTLEEFASALVSGSCKLSSFKKEGIKPMLRLHPPRKGYEAVKRPFSLGGTLGYRGEEINKLIGRML